MKLIKYDRAKGDSVSGTTIINSTTNSSSSDGDINYPSRGSGRNIWGQYDNGIEDIDGSMIVNGNITVKAIVPPTYDDDEGGDGEDIDEETGGGNLDVEINANVGNKTTTKELAVTNDANIGNRTSTKELYLNGVDIMEYFKQHNIHIAYADSKDGSTNFIKHTTTANPDSYMYLGLHVGKDVSDAALTRSDYKWIKMIGGGGASIYGLLPVTEWAKVKDTDVLQVSMQYKVMKIANGAISVFEAEEFTAEGLTIVYLAGDTTENVMTNNDHLIASSFMSNWSKSALAEFTIRLKKDGNIVDQRIVPIIYDAKDAISDHNRIVVLENKPDKDTIYDDTELRNRITALENKPDTGTGTSYDDTELRNRITALENKPDKDTIYDDTDLKNRVTALENKPDKDTIYDDTDLKNRVTALENKVSECDNKVTNGQYDHPIVLWSGRLYRIGSDDNLTSYTSWSIKSYCGHMNFGSPSITIKDGLMTLSLNPLNGVKLNISSVNVNQYSSFDTRDLTRTELYDRNEGAHFFEARTDNHANTTKIYIREFHNGGRDNDSWDSNSWVNNNGINSIFVTILGYVTPNESSPSSLYNSSLYNVAMLENSPSNDIICDDTGLNNGVAENGVTTLKNSPSNPSNPSSGQGSSTTKTILLEAPTDPSQSGDWEIDVDEDMVVILSGKENTQSCCIRMSNKTTIPNGRKITFVNPNIVTDPWKIGRTGDIFCLYSYKSDDHYQRDGFDKSNVLTDEQYVNLAGGHSATLVYYNGTWYQIAD